MSSELIERLEKRAKTYSWDSTTFYASDADLMLKSAAKLAQLQAELAEARKMKDQLMIAAAATVKGSMDEYKRGYADATQKVPGRIVAWLIGGEAMGMGRSEIIDAIEARDWSKP